MRLILAVLAFSPLAVQAQSPGIRIETIRADEVEVRCEPGSKTPVTSILRKGARVYVRGQVGSGEGTYLQILPPPGSVSWVPAAVVTKMGAPVRGRQAFRIDGDSADGEVPIHAGGTSLDDGPLPQLSLKVPRGTQGFIRGNPVAASWGDRKKWYPIDPLPGEVRYIPASALQESNPADIAARKRGSVTGQLTSTPARDGTTLFRQARQADAEGRIDEAIELYQQAARELSVSDDAAANFCATRVYELRQRRNLGNASLTSRPQNSSPTDPRPAPRRGSTEFTPPPFGGGNDFTPPPTRNALPAGWRASGPGLLRRAPFQIDQRATYALLDRQRNLMYYVTAEPGLNLEPFVERWVDLHGTVENREDVRGAPHLRVAHVFLLR
ncbi:MAG: hypothetical protein N2039_06430 [Gemmataceae bacterium]|nr:hypothetical protein [Gemmataceae bacterium]